MTKIRVRFGLKKLRRTIIVLPAVAAVLCAGLAGSRAQVSAGGSAGATDPAGLSAPRKLAAQASQVDGTEITPDQEHAVALGLEYLAKHQSPDGSFGNSGGYGATVAITSLSGLAFMANGNLPGRGKYGDNVRKALEFVTHNQQESGLFTTNASQGEMYSHGFSTLFVGEVYGMTGDDELKENLQRAVRLIERAQNSEGGWRYQPVPVDADISVTICQVMALRAARDAGIKVESGVIDKAIGYVRRCQNADGGFSYQAMGGESGFARTAAGTAALYYAGIFQDNAVSRGLDYLARFQPGVNQNNSEENGHFFYGQYYAVQAMFLAGGKYWSAWYPGIRDLLIARQNKDSGEWDKEVVPEYCTAMALIILQMPNRYLPVFNGKGPGG
ncbi:MAG: terpene cyclase/mutase family protein [Planctomycetota bacterium]|nr:terpene cyclase/mutase family protein [Planctomycetota bacterium]